MGFFKARKKEIEEFETDMDLPSFSIDVNGFVMFDNPLLGGAAVFEVFSNNRTEGVTQVDPLYPKEEVNLKEGYEPSTGALFSNERAAIYPPWVHFLNSLQSAHEAEDPTHLQLLVKKCHADEWRTKTDYGCFMAHKEFDKIAAQREESDDLHEALIGARADDYIMLMEFLKNDVDTSSPEVWDPRRLASYVTRFFLIVSYTPSSEGWWLDGRDTDYYVSDSNVPSTILGGNEDKIVDKVVGLISRKKDKKEEAREGGAEDDFFWIEADRTAQVILTRVNKLLRAVNNWNKENRSCPMPFRLEQMSPRDTAALIRFFPNILTPYWEKIYELETNQNDVLYSQDVAVALHTDDEMFFQDQDDLFEAIKEDRVDMRSRHSAEEQEKFLNRYKGKEFDEIAALEGDHDDLFWTPEQEEENRARAKALANAQSAAMDFWGDVDEEAAASAADDDFKSQAQKRAEFLNEYKNRGGGNVFAGLDDDDEEEKDLPALGSDTKKTSSNNNKKKRRSSSNKSDDSANSKQRPSNKKKPKKRSSGSSQQQSKKKKRPSAERSRSQANKKSSSASAKKGSNSAPERKQRSSKKTPSASAKNRDGSEKKSVSTQSKMMNAERNRRRSRTQRRRSH